MKLKRPLLFASLGLLFGVPALLLALGVWWLLRSQPSWRGRSPVVITVEASYPGANAATVAESVADPIEQQVNGVENATRYWSQCGNDGKYVLHVEFAPNTDLEIAQVLVQNRVSLAQPVLPAVVMQTGVSVSKKAPHPVLFICLYSPGGRYDALYLGNFATIQIRDELLRLPGVGDVACLGPAGAAVRLSLDLERLAALDLTPADVARAVQVHQPKKPEDFGEVIVKVDAGKQVHLRDVARVEMGPGHSDSFALLDGQPAVILAVYPLCRQGPGEVSAAVAKKLDELRTHFPEGLEASIPVDLSSSLRTPVPASQPEYLRLDLELPEGISARRKQEVLARCDRLLRELPGVASVLASSENPFAQPAEDACAIIRLEATARRSSTREDILAVLRARLEEVESAVPRLCDLSRPGAYPNFGYPVDLAISGPDGEAVRKLASHLAERLRESPAFTDVGVSAGGREQTQQNVLVDRAKCTELGVSVKEVMDTLQVVSGSPAGDIGQFGRTWKVTIGGGERPADRAEVLQKAQVRAANGKLVPLASVVVVRHTAGPVAVERLDLSSAARVTANPAVGISLREARKLCEGLFETTRAEMGLGGCRLTWMSEALGR